MIVTENQSKLQEWILGSNNIVFFGGAGVSTESGIPDFRSVDGLYSLKYTHQPETILSHSFFEYNKKEFFRFHRDKMICLDAKPNAAHQKLAELEQAGRLKAVITQNIDGLHQQAGSRKVLELHGSVHRNYCQSCHELYDARYMLDSPEVVPVCEKCGGFIKPDVVLYEESLNSQTLREAVSYLSRAEVLIVGGTSLAVYPAAGLIDYYSGTKLALINRTATPMDDRANLVIKESIGDVLGGLNGI